MLLDGTNTVCLQHTVLAQCSVEVTRCDGREELKCMDKSNRNKLYC